ncbi:hypothetical protein E2P86_16350 [Sphingobacterium psychroaquaticum]|nr:hypothetical protein E2P86_16350 [Sphingobacterium psychroaquaticum]
MSYIIKMKEVIGRSSQKKSRLRQLIKAYRSYLFEDYLPFLDRFIFDEQHGGFFWNTTYSGEILGTNKRTWYDARGAWVYSFLYQNFDRNPLYLRKAKQTLDLLLRVKSPAQQFWPWSYDHEGVDLKERPGDIYGNLFVAEAFAAYAEAADDVSYWIFAKQRVLEAFEWYQDPAYRYALEYRPDPLYGEASEVLGHYMIILHVCTGMLRYKADLELNNIVTECIDALLTKHVHPVHGLMVELQAKPGNDLPVSYEQFVYLGHAIEALWMVLDEAMRRHDFDLFQLAAQRFKQHVEVAWDDLHGGFFHCLNHVDDYHFLTDKVLWAQEEVLIGCLILWEEQDDSWAKTWFWKTYNYMEKYFVRHDLPYKPWKLGGGRKMDKLDVGYRIENYHHPRHLMFSLLSLDRILKNTI